jgi:hypothetical protein
LSALDERSRDTELGYEELLLVVFIVRILLVG